MSAAEIKHARAQDLLACLVVNGILREQCACGCDEEHHPDGSFCHVCWGDNCNYYRKVFVFSQRKADEYDARHKGQT
jgi:hypothetical protein